MTTANEANRRGPCEICGLDTEYGTDWAVRARSCPRCGTFEYHSPVGWLEVKTPDHLVRLSGWVREQNDMGVQYPNITPDISRQVARMQLPGLRERANRALVFLAAHVPGIDDWYDPQQLAEEPELLGRTYSADAASARVLIQLLADRGSLREHQGAVGISVAGLLAAEDLGRIRPGSAQGFVAMSFDAKMTDAWLQGFDPAIRAAGYAPLRIDAKEYIGGISDEIMTEIRRSAFVVVDYTDQKNGVYFEAGFALGLGLQVIPTCHLDEIDKLHFDIRHLNTLAWDSPSKLAASLSKRIVSVIGWGPTLTRTS